MTDPDASEALSELRAATESLYRLAGRAANLSAGEKPEPGPPIDDQWLADWEAAKERLDQAEREWRAVLVTSAVRPRAGEG